MMRVIAPIAPAPKANEELGEKGSAHHGVLDGENSSKAEQRWSSVSLNDLTQSVGQPAASVGRCSKQSLSTTIQFFHQS